MRKIHFKDQIQVFLFLVVASLLLPQKSHAYLDPGTGSFFIQTLVAFLLGGVFAVKMFWKNIISFFRKDRQVKKAKQDEEK